MNKAKQNKINRCPKHDRPTPSNIYIYIRCQLISIFTDFSFLQNMFLYCTKKDGIDATIITLRAKSKIDEPFAAMGKHTTYFFPHKQ